MDKKQQDKCNKGKANNNRTKDIFCIKKTQNPGCLYRTGFKRRPFYWRI